MAGRDRMADRDARGAFRALLPAVERLEAGGGVAEWSGGSDPEGGSPTLPYVGYDEATGQVMDAFGGGGPLTDPEYGETLERRGHGGRPLDLGALAPGADEELARALLTGLVRSERFGEGSVAAALEDGSLVALLRRLRGIYEL